MIDTNKKVFLSYRREQSKYAARAVYQDLKSQGYDVFMDVESIDSGEFSKIILHQITARPHFLIILSPGSLDRTKNQGDWLRREIEYALEKKRNIVPVLMEKFDFKDAESKHANKKLPGKIAKLKDYNYLTVPNDYFEDAMKKLTSRFLKKKINISTTKTPKSEIETIDQMQLKADLAEVDLTTNSWIFPKSKLIPSLRKFPLKAPVLKNGIGTMNWGLSASLNLSWTKIIGSSGYVVEMSSDKTFKKAKEVYNGENTSYFEFTNSSLALGLVNFGNYCRVKAKGGYLSTDSPWSNIVEVTPPAISPVFKTPLPAPKLEKYFIPGDLGNQALKWAKISRASGYVLEWSMDKAFTKPVEMYNGDNASILNYKPISLHLSGLPEYYRIKAKGGFSTSDSMWSNIVELQPSSIKPLNPVWTPLPAPVLENIERKDTLTMLNLRWTKINGATAYELQQSFFADFIMQTDLYSGPNTSWIKFNSLSTTSNQIKFDNYYRVKAKGLSKYRDSAWSNVVKA